MHERDFIEVETPTLTRSTPEGARDFLVPARLKPGSWYALPQSPQLFKQLLMVAGAERYYQIARCYRDEDFRADRQPEFTQLDIEMSFVDQDDVIELGEAVVGALWSDLAGYEIPRPIPRLTYAEAMARYGSDKPDLRFGIELTDLTEYFADTPFRVFQAPHVGAVVMPGGGSQPRRQFDAWQEWARQRGARGLAYVTVGDDGTLGGPVAKNLSDAERDGLAKAVGAEPGDAIFFGAGHPADARALLGAARGEIARRCGLVDESAWSFVWVVDAPMFERIRDDKGNELGWTAVHHPFTSPNAQWIDRFEDDPANALAYAYDIVCNGNEIGGGSIRIHRRRAAAGVRAARDGRARAAREVRLPPRRVPARAASARRDRLRLGPHVHAARRCRLAARGDRVPEDGQRLRSAHLGTGADHPRAAPRSGCRRQAARRAGGAADRSGHRGTELNGPPVGGGRWMRVGSGTRRTEQG